MAKYSQAPTDPPIDYVESSALAAAILEADRPLMARLTAANVRVTSALTSAECRRAILRARLSARITQDEAHVALRTLDAVLRSCSIVPIADEILVRSARPFPNEPVRTLDAIHLATVEAIGTPDVVVVSRDLRIRENAAAMGYRVA